MKPKKILRPSENFSGANRSRRKFLQTAALATGVTILGFPSLLRAGNTSKKINVAHIGFGGMGRGRLTEMLGCNANILALCDVDENQFPAARQIVAKAAFKPQEYVDFREMLEKEKDLDGIVITTPDHWHAPITTAALAAGKHVFCEKPLTHTISEARAVRKLAKKHANQMTQMGNQGSASPNLRRGIEIIQGGALGQIHEVHCWMPGGGVHPGLATPTVGDHIPQGLHWDAWLGVAPARPYKKGYYHPANWRGWYDFGSGIMGDWGCHGLNLPFRALKLDYAKRISAEGELTGLPTYSGKNHIQFEFGQRGNLDPVTVHWYDVGRKPGAGVIPAELLTHLGELPETGVLIIGEYGWTFGEGHSCSDYIKLKDESNISGIQKHEATQKITKSLPRVRNHVAEWVDACAGGPPTFSNFEIGGHLTEIALSGLLPLKLQKPIDWDGEKMRAVNAPEAKALIESHYRDHWKI
jgi:predicted dehydrogenase